MIPGPHGPQGEPGADGTDGQVGPQGPAGIDGASISAQDIARIDDLETRFSGVSRIGADLVLTGMNLQVVSGSGDLTGTAAEPVNGLGNIFIGYNEDIDSAIATSQKTGSHNLIVGKGNN